MNQHFLANLDTLTHFILKPLFLALVLFICFLTSKIDYIIADRSKDSFMKQLKINKYRRIVTICALIDCILIFYFSAVLLLFYFEANRANCIASIFGYGLNIFLQAFLVKRCDHCEELLNKMLLNEENISEMFK